MIQSLSVARCQIKKMHTVSLVGPIARYIYSAQEGFVKSKFTQEMEDRGYVSFSLGTC
jgi:hypothetical protein